jgi:hypothetical protein
MNIKLIHFNVFRARCLQIMKTPTPGTGPVKKEAADKGVSSEIIRATMTATGGRNQRRINNLRTELKNRDGDEEVEVLVDSVHSDHNLSFLTDVCFNGLIIHVHL